MNVPSDADLLTFNLSVMDPGNDDHVLVMVGGDVVQDIDLASVQSVGGATEQVWIKDYAGEPETITFYMPSGVPSSAEFSISDVNFVAVDFPPVASADPNGVAIDNSTATFTVTYTDPDDSVQYSSIDGNDILVTGPNGFSHLAALVNVDQPGDGQTRTATYRITAPGSTWAQNDTGSYTAWMQSDQVSDTSGNNFVVPGAIGAFNITPPTVTAKNLTATGFTMQFSSALDASQLNLYDQGGTLGPADVVLTGSATGVVSGSLVMNSTGDGFTFIKTGGLLAPDTYTITLRSAANGFKGTTGLLLDGNGDGTGGDNYTSTFTVISPPTDAVTVSLPDFARGYGQPVNVPASGTGLPLTISSGQNVGSLSLTLDYDPNLLTISSFTQAAGLSATLDTSTSGVAILTVTSTGQFSSATGTFTVGTFSAQVPEEAPYASKEVLHIADLHVYDDSATPLEIPSLADDAVHVAAYFGDTNGSQTYSSADAVLLLRIASQMNTGFSAYQLADPVLIGDTTGNGAIQSSDAVGMLRVASRIPFPNVPSLPGLPLQTTLGGPDPKVFIPQDLTGEAGDTITVPVNLLVTESGGITISSADVELDYDSTKFDVSNARLGTLLSDAGFTGSFNTTIPGKIFFSGASATGTTLLSLNTAGSLYLVDFTVKADAANGTSPLNLVSAELTDNNLNDLVLTPPPTSASTDAVDGVFTISSNQAPTVATAASATPSPVTGTTTALSVLGADDGGESNLTYTWATTGTLPAAVNFSVNGTNGAKNTTATFSKAGTYNFQVAITDQGGLTVTSSVTVMVSQTLTTITVSPANLTLNENQTQQFTATGKDQFGVALTTQPTFTWGTTAGTISAGGLLTAPSTSVSNGTVTASSGTVSGTATFVVGNQAPTVATAASATPSPVTGTTTALSVLGADDGGESNLTYTWATTGTLPAAVNFSVNGTNGAKNTTATFSKAGNYAFTVTITDQGGLTVTSSVTVMVSQTLTSITVTPASVTLNENQTQQFTATGLDQFGVALSTQPSLTWTKASGVGSISAGGLYTAPAATGSASITATGGSVVGNAGVTVSNAVPRVATAASATPSPATGTTTNLSVLGADDGGERNLTYKWATTGTPPAAVNFSVNDTNGAKNTTATFSKAGTYNFQVTITDQGSLTVTSPVSVTVDQTLTTIAVSPISVILNENQTQQFTATGYDQFDVALSTQPSVTWGKASGVGSISATGLYTAPAATGSANITATSGSVVGSDGVTIKNAPPTVATPASATPSPVTRTTTSLSALGADDGGESNLTYKWATTGTPPAMVNFSVNGTNGAKNTTATFSKAGTYNFQVTITDAGGLTVTSSVSVTVSQTLTTITVSPASVTLNENQTQQFTATGLDQFGVALSTQPSFTWTKASGAGSVSAGGLYTAPAATGSAGITATSGSLTGRAAVTVSIAVPAIGLYDPFSSMFMLRNTNDSGFADECSCYGVANAGWLPIVGDWTGDGIQSMGLYDPTTSTFYLRNTNCLQGPNDKGYADTVFVYGPANSDMEPIAGDWTGDGRDTIGLYDPATSTFYLRNSNCLQGPNDKGYADIVFNYGPANSGMLPVVGDWDGSLGKGGSRQDGIGLYNEATAMFYLRESTQLQGPNDKGYADATLNYGVPRMGCLPVAGDWNGDGKDGIGLYDQATATFYLRNAIQLQGPSDKGYADLTFMYGKPNALQLPVVGDWTGAIFANHLLAAGGEVVASANTPGLTQAELQPIVSEAIAGWASAGLDAAGVQKLRQVQFAIGDLPGGTLAEEQGNLIRLDNDAAGHGWFVDSTPASDEEFASSAVSPQLQAVDPRAVDRIDLLTVVEHELGHAAGLPDLDALVDDVMSGVLGVGVRRDVSHADAVLAS